MFQYHVWASKKLFDYLQSEEVKPLFFREVQSVFPSISEVAAHMLTVDHLWFERIKGVENEGGVPVQFTSVGEAAEKMLQLHEDISTFLAQANTNQLIEYQTSEGEPYTNTIGEVIMHIVNHGTYHRGNITAILRQLGGKGVSTDYIYFLRERK
ncbi:hypothetical protein AC623_02460 [Bacillus sp. FJAT-27231]|uniref:DinB family protein n=1 Tax=Bacillus sp. FJAT-27231 TaxID=1679168 RepID=UPI0006708F5D|nr:DinB family protein [Bacillus sp. FJAT-27231]KMY52993.1 hypothetical protein AC623_02460 [Bacillus sp. FJAT-27231]